MASEKDLVEKIDQNKFHIKLVLKSQEAKQGFQAQLLKQIAAREIDIGNWDLIQKFLIVYQARTVIPSFKEAKTREYVQALSKFSWDEMKNADYQAKCWGDFNSLADASMKAFKIGDKAQER